MPRVAMERSGEMEVFVRVVQEGGFSAAARTLDLTPSAVSKLIARLEDRLGVRLLARTTRALSLTEEGEAYHRSALRLLEELNEAEQVLSRGKMRGRLRVNVSVPFGTHMVVPALKSFQGKYPEVTIDLSLTDDVINLLEQKTDVAIRVGNLPDSALVARKLGQSRRIACASPAYLEKHGIPKVPADLLRHNCILFNFRRTRVGWPFREGDRQFEQTIAGTISVNNGETARQLALDGIGIARLGRFHVTEAIAQGTLVPLLEEYNGGDWEPIHAIYLGGGEVPGRVRAFIDHMADWVSHAPAFR
jgi:DNA-binding transcriptional LysR family regulator